MDDSLEEFLGQKGIDLKQALEDLRRKEFSFAVSEMKQSLAKQGRCIVCTLALPCGHYSSAAEMPSVALPARHEFSLHQFTQGLNISALSHTGALDASRKLVVRVKNNSVSPRFKGAVPTARRLKVLEQIEAYRESKLNKEIHRIEQLRAQEGQEKRRRDREDNRRNRRQLKLKEQLDKRKGELARKEYAGARCREGDGKRERLREERRQKYLKEQKKKLEEYYEKKRISEAITQQKVEELQEDVLKYDPAQVYV